MQINYELNLQEIEQELDYDALVQAFNELLNEKFLGEVDAVEFDGCNTCLRSSIAVRVSGRDLTETDEEDFAEIIRGIWADFDLDPYYVPKHDPIIDYIQDLLGDASVEDATKMLAGLKNRDIPCLTSTDLDAISEEIWDQMIDEIFRIPTIPKSLQERVDAFVAEELDDLGKYLACCNCGGSWQKHIVVPHDLTEKIFISDWISPSTIFTKADILYSFPSAQDLANADLSEWGCEDCMSQTEHINHDCEIDSYLEYCFDELESDLAEAVRRAESPDDD